jgi:hypothetical protein
MLKQFFGAYRQRPFRENATFLHSFYRILLTKDKGAENRTSALLLLNIRVVAEVVRLQIYANLKSHDFSYNSITLILRRHKALVLCDS